MQLYARTMIKLPFGYTAAASAAASSDFLLIVHFFFFFNPRGIRLGDR